MSRTNGLKKILTKYINDYNFNFMVLFLFYKISNMLQTADNTNRNITKQNAAL